MKTKLFLAITAVAFLVTVAVVAEDCKPCQLGTAWAVDPGRKLAEKEEIVKVEGGIITTSQRETPNSSHIVFRRCILLAGKEVVIGGSVPWVKECGNALIQTEGWILPPASWQKIDLSELVKSISVPPGPPGPPGPQGEQGIQGLPAEWVPPPSVAPKKSNKKWYWIAAGGAVAGVVTGIVMSRQHSNDNGGGSVIIIRPNP